MTDRQFWCDADRLPGRQFPHLARSRRDTAQEAGHSHLRATLIWRIDHGLLRLTDARGGGLRAYAPAHSPFHGPVTDVGQPAMAD